MSQPFLFPECRFAVFPRVCPLSVERIFVSGSDIALELLAVFNTNCGINSLEITSTPLPARLLPVCTNEWAGELFG